MSKLLAALLLTYSMQAGATLFCWNSGNNVGMTYNAGVLSYEINGQPTTNPGAQVLPAFGSDAYCWADGPELLYLYQALPDLRYPTVTTTRSGATTFRKSLQHPDGIVYFTGEDAWSIINNL